MRLTRALPVAVAAAVLLGGCGEGGTRASIVGYHPGSGNTVVVTIELGPADTFKQARATKQTPTQVTVEALIERGGNQPAIAVHKDVAVRLDEPLGSRTVVAAGSETTVPSVTTPSSTTS